MSEDEVVIRVEGGVGRISLNRPRALHALTHGMCRSMTRALRAWADDPALTAVILDHVGDRGFCAGGDIRRLTKGNGPAAAVTFFGVEYRLNHLMFVYPKPILAVMHGVTMGGGVGISQPARFRIATEKTVFAMPETGIGLFPDVGGGWYLPRLPGRVGHWLGLTGARLKADDCLALGLATHFVPEAGLDRLKAEVLARPGALEDILAPFAQAPGPGTVAGVRPQIDRLFYGDTVEAILANLRSDGGAWAAAQLAILATKSPLALKVTLRQLSEGARAVTFADEMAVEYRLARRMSAAQDFREGVRALLVDRDNAPAWVPATLDAVSNGMVDAVFAPLPQGQEWTPLDGLDREERR